MEFLVTLIKGFSEVFLLENVLLGVIIAIAIGIISPFTLLLALLGGSLTTAVSTVMKVNKLYYELGLCSFNGILIGCVTSFYIKSFPLSILFVLIGSIIGGFIFSFLIKNNVTPFAIPFVVVALLFTFIVKLFKLI